MARAMQRVNTAIDSKRLFIYDGVGNTLEGISADITANISEGDVVLLDYMQRTPPPQGSEWQSRQVQIQEASRSLLNTAREAQCVIIAGAQINREVEKGKGREATQADMRESGDIENDAHNIIAIEPKDGKPAYMHPIKAREGGQTYELQTLEAVTNYIYWTGTSEYSPSQEAKAKKQPEQEAQQAQKDEYDDGFNAYRRMNGLPIPQRRTK
jgi:hypothetical protein